MAHLPVEYKLPKKYHQTIIIYWLPTRMELGWCWEEKEGVREGREWGTGRRVSKLSFMWRTKYVTM